MTDTSPGSDAGNDPGGRSEPDPAGPSATSALRSRRRVHPAVLIGAALLVVAVAGGAWFATRPQEYRITVPAGTGARIDGGEQVELIPRDLALSVGDTMVIENQDQRNHTVGPFAVRAGETLRYTFSNSGVFKGACSVHPSGEVTITVS